MKKIIVLGFLLGACSVIHKPTPTMAPVDTQRHKTSKTIAAITPEIPEVAPKIEIDSVFGNDTKQTKNCLNIKEITNSDINHKTICN